jgi:hypothetical protein
VVARLAHHRAAGVTLVSPEALHSLWILWFKWKVQRSDVVSFKSHEAYTQVQSTLRQSVHSTAHCSTRPWINTTFLTATGLKTTQQLHPN